MIIIKRTLLSSLLFLSLVLTGCMTTHTATKKPILKEEKYDYFKNSSINKKNPYSLKDPDKVIDLLREHRGKPASPYPIWGPEGPPKSSSFWKHDNSR